MVITSDLLAGAAGILLSLVFSFTPGLGQWFSAKDPVVKRLFMLGAVVVVAAAAFGLSCAHVSGLPFTVECTQQGAVGLVQSVVVCLIANQTTDRITPNVGAGKTTTVPVVQTPVTPAVTPVTPA